MKSSRNTWTSGERCTTPLRKPGEKEFSKRKSPLFQTSLLLPQESINSLTGLRRKLKVLTFYNEGLSSLLTQPQSERKSDVLPEIKLGTPDALDWRTNNILTPVRDQGDCGVCWAFTSVGMVEAFLVQNGLQTLNIDLAEQYLAECTAGSSCDGGFIETGLDKINKKCPEESQFEYTAPTLYGGDICTATGIDTAFKRSSYYSISDAEMINLLQSGPVAVGVASTGWSDYVSGTITCSDSDQVDHAVIVVGYTADAYIIRNSWADTWGEDGYAYVSRTAS